MRALRSVLVFIVITLIGSCNSAEISENSCEAYVELLRQDVQSINQFCQPIDSPAVIGPIDVFAILVFASFAAILLSSTIYDFHMTNMTREPNKLFIAFSLYTNGRQLFDITKSKSSNAIHCLHGIRALSVLWIIFGHRFDERFMVPAVNSEEVSRFTEKPISLIHTTFTLAVDTFLLMGGLLATLSFLSALDWKTLNISRFYLHRYIRYTPVLMILILFFVTFPKFIVSGPFANLDLYVPHCEKFWWSALLHVQNYVNPNELCLDWSWYLSVDFQLFVLSPLLIYPLWKWGWKFFWVLPVLIFLSMGCVFASSYTNDISVFVGRMIPKRGKEDWERLIYFPTHARMGPWIVGIILGYAVHESKKRKVEMCRIVNALLWIVSLSTLLAILLCFYPFQRLDENNTTTKLGNAFYNATFRVVWSCALAWIIFSCHNGSGGIIRWFLSLQQWQPIGKMGLSIYLVHRIYQILTIVSQKQPLYFEFSTQLHKFFGDIIAVIALGSILYLTFEVPFLLIENHVYMKLHSRK